jgi:hypothetical protein
MATRERNIMDADTLQNEVDNNNIRIKRMETFIRGAIAALSQNKTFPADIEAAKTFLNSALEV